MSLVLAIVYAAALVLGSPLIGQVRAAIRAEFPRDFVPVVASLMIIVIGGAFLAALLRRPERRWLRLGILAAALAFGTLVAHAMRTGSAEVDIVERFHFVQYGLLTVLFYRVWRSRKDAATWILPLLAGLVVASLDEWVQWFVPSRVGEFHDVMLDVISCGCGLLFCAGFDPPDSVGAVTRLGPGGRARIGMLGAAATVGFAFFFQSVHVGYLVAGPEGSVFLSTNSAEELASASRDRAARWRTAPPVVPRLYSEEDRYLAEALWHVRRRNRAWAEGEVRAAWMENRILEVFFAPALDTRSYYAADGFRWADSQRKDAESRAGTLRFPYVSDAEPYPMYPWPKSMYWTVVLAVAAGFALVALEARGVRGA